MKEKKTGIRNSDLLALATGSLVANKLRSALTIMGITVGVFSVVAVMTALSAMRLSINTGLSQLGANTFQISKMPAINARWWEYWNRPSINYAQGHRFEQMMLDLSPSSLVSLTVGDGGHHVSYNSKTMNSTIDVLGINESSLVTNNRAIAQGRNLTADDVLFRRPFVIIGSKVQEELFPSEDPLGKRIIMSGHAYTIVGVLEKKGEVFGNDMDGYAAIPVTVFIQRYWNNRWRSIDIAIQAPEGQPIEAVQDIAIGAMRIVRDLPPEEVNNFEIYSNDSLKATFDKMAVIIGSAGLIISAIALITAGVGVMNIMLVSVTERTREIGVRKSIGARSQDILIQFLLEAIFISQVGAVIGIILGIAAGDGIGMLLNVKPVMPWFWVAVAVVTCTAIGLIFGAYPAWRAAKMDPVEALRCE
ncbi:MAG: ABC transporter permease [Opitutales bacterium]|jgi:putative ABC transport system permease protein